MSPRVLLMIGAVVLAILGGDARAFAQTPTLGTSFDRPNSNIGDLSRELICRTSGTDQLRCRGLSLAPSPNTLTVGSLLNTVNPNKAAGTAFSLYFGNNLATEKTTATFLKGVTGSEALGAKLAPTIMRLSKSAGARFGLGVAMVGTGVYAVYKYLAGAEKVDTPASKSLDALTEDKTFRYQLLGIVHENGRFQTLPPAPKP